MKISVVTSLYRTAPYIEELCTRLVAAIRVIGADDYELILVNDQSPDNDLAVAKALAAKDPKIVVIDLARNFGQHAALVTGIRYSDGDYVFAIDGDLEEEPEWMVQFHSEMARTGCDVAYGVHAGTKGGIAYRLGRKAFYGLLNILSSVAFPQNVVTARLMTRRYVDAMLEYKERELFLSGIWHMVGFAQIPVSVIKGDRSPSTYTIGSLIYLFINGVTSFSIRPLGAISAAGVILSGVAIFFTGWVFVRRLFFNVSVEGWASVMAAVLVVGGVSMFFNGVMAIYIAKIFLEVKQRPLATIREIYNGKSTAKDQKGGRSIARDLSEDHRNSRPT